VWVVAGVLNWLTNALAGPPAPRPPRVLRGPALPPTPVPRGALHSCAPQAPVPRGGAGPRARPPSPVHSASSSDAFGGLGEQATGVTMTSEQVRSVVGPAVRR
jgi:hypothetical protein